MFQIIKTPRAIYVLDIWIWEAQVFKQFAGYANERGFWETELEYNDDIFEINLMKSKANLITL